MVVRSPTSRNWFSVRLCTARDRKRFVRFQPVRSLPSPSLRPQSFQRRFVGYPQGEDSTGDVLEILWGTPLTSSPSFSCATSRGARWHPGPGISRETCQGRRQNMPVGRSKGVPPERSLASVNVRASCSGEVSQRQAGECVRSASGATYGLSNSSGACAAAVSRLRLSR